MIEYPYMNSNNKIVPIIAKIQQAARPPKFTQEFLKSLGFTSTNDRAFIPLFKKLGFLTDDGTPTQLYNQLKDQTSAKSILATQIKQLYAELYVINTQIHSATDSDIKGAISRVTGKDEAGVNRIFNTFKVLCAYADFSLTANIEPTVDNVDVGIQHEITSVPLMHTTTSEPQFHYNIQIHLPATTDISVYNCIFKSLKENLLM